MIAQRQNMYQKKVQFFNYNLLILFNNRIGGHHHATIIGNLKKKLLFEHIVESQIGGNNIKMYTLFNGC